MHKLFASIVKSFKVRELPIAGINRLISCFKRTKLALIIALNCRIGSANQIG